MSKVPVIFDGPQPARDVNVGEGRTVRFERGKPQDIPERVAEQLVEQSYFSYAEKSTRTSKTDTSGSRPWGLEPTEPRHPQAETKEEE